jgi:hypothetical protein
VALGHFSGKGRKKPRLFIKFYTDHRQFVYIRGWEVGSGKWGDFSVISKQLSVISGGEGRFFSYQ